MASYNTRKGQKTEEQLRYELAAAGYPGPWDIQSMLAAYDRANGGGGTPGGGSSSGGGSSGGGGTSSGEGDFWARLMAALTGSNQQQFDWAKEQFMKQFGLDEKKFAEFIRQFNETMATQKDQFARTQYANLAQSILNGAINLQGPRDWLKYAEYTNGGRDIFKALYGDKAVPAFGSPSGYSEKRDITDVLKALGITVAPTPTGTTTVPAGLSDEGAYDWIWQNRPDLAGFYAKNGWDLSTPEKQRAAVQNWIGGGDPQWKGMTPQQVAMALGYKSPTTKTSQSPEDQLRDILINPAPQREKGPMDYGAQPEDADRIVNPVRNTPTTGRVPSNTSPYWGPPPPTYDEPIAKPTGVTQYDPNLVPLPHQMNPAVWDSLNDSAKQLILASAEGGHTPSGVWTANDYLRQLNAARPKGQAPTRIAYAWGRPRGSFF